MSASDGLLLRDALRRIAQLEHLVDSMAGELSRLQAAVAKPEKPERRPG